MAIDITAVADLVRSVPMGLLIDRRFTDAADGSTFDVFNPATEEHLATLASAGESDAREALDVACRVQGDWARTPARHRQQIGGFIGGQQRFVDVDQRRQCHRPSIAMKRNDTRRYRGEKTAGAPNATMHPCSTQIRDFSCDAGSNAP